MKKFLKKTCEFVIIFLLLLLVCFYINRDIEIKGLYMDDLLDWSWFRGLSLYDFAIKFYKASRYRPVFESIQYLFYSIIGTDIFRYVIINKVYNTIIAIYIYYLAKKFDTGRFVALIISFVYLISHYAYYQIGQGIGSLESDALFFTIIILYHCLKLSSAILLKDENNNMLGANSINNTINTIIIFIMFFLISFTHERFLGLALPILIAIFFQKDEINTTKKKIISIIIFLIEIGIICYIRYIAIGKVMPAGTGGTYVEETFNLIECIKYCFIQVAIIFGINIGPDYLMGVEFFTLSENIKITTLISIVLIFAFIICYIIARFKYKSKRNLIAGDLIFLSFIAMCIGASSVTIRVELRFVYVSFTLAILYLGYMYGFIINNIKTNRNIYMIMILAIFLFRLPVELVYRTYFPKIHCYVDLSRVNSIYDNTIGAYGVDEVLHNKKIYIVNKYFGMTDFYAEYFFKIYDKDNVGNKILLVNDISEIPINEIDDDTIILYEDIGKNIYITYPN